MPIYHIVLPQEWEKFAGLDFYEAASLATEGFIHCSYPDQVKGVLGRYYRDQEKILLLEIEPERLTSRLIAEPSTNDEIYPHIYGRINRDAIVKIEEITLRREDLPV